MELSRRAVLEKLRFEEMAKQILTSNISEIYGIQNLPLRKISKRLSQFNSRNRWTYKTHFFIFQFFSQKLTNRLNSNFTDYSY